MARASGNAGFTVIEVVVVLAVLGMALAIVAARGPLGTRTLSARAAAQELAAGLREARATAIRRNRPSLLVVDVASRSWRLGDAKPTRLPDHVALSAAVGAAETTGRAEARFRFLPDGSSSGGRVVLVDGRRSLQVGVDWLTGRVSVAQIP
jgi:general secretion pathway protein H